MEEDGNEETLGKRKIVLDIVRNFRTLQRLWGMKRVYEDITGYGRRTVEVYELGLPGNVGLLNL
jgi:hypothetical protein